MTLNQNQRFAAHQAAIPKRFRPTSARNAFSLAVFLASAAVLHGQATNVQVTTTATQAIISYSAPDTNACSVQVREGDLTGALVPDVDPAIFAGADLDSRSAGLVFGQKRIFVAGKRAAEPGLDGLRHSRALQVFTAHSYKITCGANAVSGTFTTMNAPLGMSHNDPLPVDPLNPGKYAWPDFDWTTRNQWIVDPLTGFRMKQLDSPNNAIEPIFYNQAPAGAFNIGGGTAWSNPAAAISNQDNGAAATYSGASQGALFVDLGIFIGSIYSAHNYYVNSLNTLTPSMNAYCSSTDCNSASADDRTIQTCLSIDGSTCASDWIESMLQPCLSNCNTDSFTFALFAKPKPILADWFASRKGVPTIDQTDILQRKGFVNRTGAAVTLAYGDTFNLNWKAGSRITINNVPYTIASVDHEGALTLAGSPTGSDTFSSYLGSNAGLLIRKKTTGAQQISIQSITVALISGQPADSGSGGDEDWANNCAPKQVPGPNGEMGYHCSLSGTIYWVGLTTGAVNRLARTYPPPRDGADGFGYHSCANAAAYWDWDDGNVMYCAILTNSQHTNLLKFSYNGDNADVGDLNYYTWPVECSATLTTNCWKVDNLTPGTNALDFQMLAFNPDEISAAHFKIATIALFGRMGASNSLLFLARRAGNNDTASIIYRFDLNTSKIAASLASWANSPLRWAGHHGPGSLNDPNWVPVAATFFRGPFTGNDYTAGNGPYYSVITTPGGIGQRTEACPPWPTGSPIPQSTWPTGNNCLTITVDGEPGDPTPAIYTDGTISVTGTALTGNGTYFLPYMDQSLLKLNGNTYTFTYVSTNQATLDRSPGTITNSPYTLILEAIDQVDAQNHPKVGSPGFVYLQDAKPGDIFCLGGAECVPPAYQRNEFARLLARDPQNPLTWIIQRGYAGVNAPRPLRNQPEGIFLVAMPSSCNFTNDDPCTDAHVVWDAVNDLHGTNSTGNTILFDPNDDGCCHSSRQNNIAVDIGSHCPDRGGFRNSGCYFARYSGVPANFTDKGFPVSLNPIFHQKVGIGSPNTVDSHPGHNQNSTSASANDLRWMVDGRVFLGGGGITGSDPNGGGTGPGTLVAGSLYKFTANQLPQMNPRIFETIAACGANPLLDVSGGPITSAPADNYKYCYAEHAGDCVSGSSHGEVYVNCPQIHYPYCTFPNLGTSSPEVRDICIGDVGGVALNVTQVAVDKADPDGINSRRVTASFGLYKWTNPYWNAKALPNGKWMVTFTTFAQGQRNAAFLVKLPPFPVQDNVKRNDFIAFNVSVPAPQVPGATVTNAVVQFGYQRVPNSTTGKYDYFCTSRRETCIQGAATDFAYASENPSGVPCSNGCTVSVPAIAQRILYYQVLLRDANNNVVGQMTPDLAAIDGIKQPR